MIAKRKSKPSKSRVTRKARAAIPKLDTRSLEEIAVEVHEFQEHYVKGSKKYVPKKEAEYLTALICLIGSKWDGLLEGDGYDRSYLPQEDREFIARYEQDFEARFPGLRQRQRRQSDKRIAANEAQRLARTGGTAP